MSMMGAIGGSAIVTFVMSDVIFFLSSFFLSFVLLLLFLLFFSSFVWMPGLNSSVVL